MDLSRDEIRIAVTSGSTYEIGYHAFTVGESLEANPYVEGTKEFHDWNTGWYRAEDGEPLGNGVQASRHPLEDIADLMSDEEREAWIAAGMPTDPSEIAQILEKVVGRLKKITEQSKKPISDDGMAHVGGSKIGFWKPMRGFVNKLSSCFTRVVLPKNE